MINNPMVAIIIADDHYNGLGVIRSLGERGIPVILFLLSKGKTVIDHSKYVTMTRKIEHSREAIIETLNSILSEDKLYVLFPLSDYVAEIIDEIRNDYGPNVIVPHADGQMRTLMNKYYLSEVFRSCGILVPEHIEYNLMDRLPQWNKFPTIIKPLASVEGLKSDIVTVSNAEELAQALGVLKSKGYSKTLIEEFVTGSDEFMIEILGFVDHEGKPHFSDVVHKVREYPIRNGSTAFAYFEKEPDYIDFGCLEKAVRSTGHTGMFDIEFKYGNGRAYFIEMNFRNGAPSYATTRKGFNIPYIWMCDRIGVSSSNRLISQKNFFMCEHRDVLNMLKGNVSIFEWILDYIKADKLIWNWRDIKPSKMMYGQVIKTALRRVLNAK